jgi:hypothetical protein
MAQAAITIAAATLVVFGSAPATAQSSTDIVGGWSYTNGSTAGTVAGTINAEAFTFTSDGKYYHAEDTRADTTGRPGMEYGTYTWNPATGALSHTTIADTNGDFGLSQSICNKAVVSGNTLTLTCADASSFSLTRTVSTASPIVGSWYVGTATSNRIFTFLSDGTYLSAANEDPALDPTGQKGMERGTYTWNAASGAFTHATTVNTDGQWGLSQSICNKAVVSGDTLTLTCADTSKPTAFGSFSATRVAAAASTGTPATPTPLDPNQTVTPPPATQAAYTVPSGQLPVAAVEVLATGTFGSASLKVTLDIVKVLQSLPASGFAASTYNVYVVALVPGALLGSPSPMFFVKPKAPGNWGPLASPIAAFLENAALNAVSNKVLIEILTDTNISTLVGTEIYIGYGTSDTDMLTAGRYRGVYKVQ